MIKYVTVGEREENQRYLEQYFRLRKKVFCDHYGWVEPTADGLETDLVDETYCVYILYLDQETDQVLGGVRMAPTTGPTLMHTVWAHMLPDPDDFRSPTIWETTRFCVDTVARQSGAGRFVNQPNLALSLAMMDFAAENGIGSIIGVCEGTALKLFSLYRAEPEIISKHTDENGVEIACVLWSSIDAIRNCIHWARPFLGGSEPITVDAA